MNIKKTLIYIILIILWTMILNADVKHIDVKHIVNQDKSLKGSWNLRPEKVWEITAAGDKAFSYPSFTVSDEGTLCVWDWKNKESYIFGPDGKYIKTFAKRGEGPGEMPMHLNSFFAGKRLVAAAPNRLHYFTHNGEYVKSVPHPYFRLEILAFIDENRFIGAPVTNLPGGVGAITLREPEGKRGHILGEFSLKEAGTGKRPRISLVGLSPALVLGYDREEDMIYYGTSGRYTIHAANLEGIAKHKFSLKRARRKISFETKVEKLKIIDPSAPAKDLAKQLPGELVYFHRIQVQNGLVYVFMANLGMNWPEQIIDIFSRDGKYLYRTGFVPPEGWHIYFSTHCILVWKKFLYVVLEDEDGEVKIAKYKITAINRSIVR